MDGSSVAPNHHGTSSPPRGLGGLLIGLSLLVGRSGAARRAIALSGLTTGERVVDIGSGPGVAAHMAHALGATVIGVDPSAQMRNLARLRWRDAEGIEWREGTAESLPAETGWADVVWSLATVHHWADIDTGLAEVRRVLAPGGRLVVVERRIRAIDGRGTASHGWIPAQADTFAEACERHGFADVTAGGAGPSLSVVARTPASGPQSMS